MDKDHTVTSCNECSNLVSSRNQIVNGVGDEDADVLFVGEAPGANEDECGEPFVGRSGEILTENIEFHGFERDDVRITNMVRCRPKNNRDPKKSEIDNCSGYLLNEITAVEPKVIVSLGKIPSEYLLNESVSVTKQAGESYERTFNNYTTTVVVSLHPAATMYNSSYSSLFTEALSSAFNKV